MCWRAGTGLARTIAAPPTCVRSRSAHGTAREARRGATNTSCVRRSRWRMRRRGAACAAVAHGCGDEKTGQRRSMRRRKLRRAWRRAGLKADLRCRAAPLVLFAWNVRQAVPTAARSYTARCEWGALGYATKPLPVHEQVDQVLCMPIDRYSMQHTARMRPLYRPMPLNAPRDAATTTECGSQRRVFRRRFSCPHIL